MAVTSLSGGAAARLSVPVPRDLISVGKAAGLLGVGCQTVRNMVARGEIEAFVLASGHRRLSRKAVLIAAGEEMEFTEEERAKVIVYGRVSSHAQGSTKKTGSSDLTRQIQRLESLAKERYPERQLVVIKDIGSGMNFDKPGLDRLISGMLSGEFRGAILLVEHKDRLARWAVPIIEKIAAHADVEIEYVEQKELGDEEMLVADLLAITTIFSVKMYSKRQAERRKKQLSPEFVERATTLINEGMSMRDVANQLEREGFRDSQGNVVRYCVIRNQIVKPLDKLKKVLPQAETPAMKFLRENTEKAPKNYRLSINDLYAEYERWCEKHHTAPVSIKRLLANLNDERTSNGEIKGLIVKGKRLHVVRREVKENVRTETMNERLMAFCKKEGLSFNVARKRLSGIA